MTNLDEDVARKIYSKMIEIRCVESTIAARYSEQEMRCPTHLSAGQEGVPAVLSVLLQNSDFAVSTHRGHAHYLGKGGDIDRMIAEIYGKETGCAKGLGGSMHLVDTSVGFMGATAIVGNTIPVGVGLALSAKLRSEQRISCVFLGDGACEEGVFFESVNFAVLHNLPVIFVCENNFYSVYSPLSVRQPENRRIFKMVRGLGCSAEHGDGNDVPTLYSLLHSAVAHVRNGRGPMFVELETYRHREHCGPFFDDDLGYRPESQLNYWNQRDPISLFESHLIENNWASVEDLASDRAAMQVVVDEAFTKAKQAAFPSADAPQKYLFRNPIR
jgi:pyruvate dehydrogenase E1 component alpha subunit